jgi:hypothetical protein
MRYNRTVEEKQMTNSDNTIPAPLTPEQLPTWFRGDPAEGDERGPFLVINKSGDVLDRRNTGGKAPEWGDGYYTSRHDYDFSPEYLAEQEANYQAMLESAPEQIKQAIAERKQKLLAEQSKA